MQPISAATSEIIVDLTQICMVESVHVFSHDHQNVLSFLDNDYVLLN